MRIETKLERAHSKYISIIEGVEADLASKIDFEFSILYQSADGFVIEHEAHNAPISSCLRIIDKKGRLTEEDYFKVTI